MFLLGKDQGDQWPKPKVLLFATFAIFEALSEAIFVKKISKIASVSVIVEIAKQIYFQMRFSFMIFSYRSQKVIKTYKSKTSYSSYL